MLLKVRTRSATIHTSPIAKSVTDNVCLAAPYASPFETLLSLYVVDGGCGAVVKLARRVDPDPLAGQLTTALYDNSRVSRVAQLG